MKSRSYFFVPPKEPSLNHQLFNKKNKQNEYTTDEDVERQIKNT